MAPTSLWNSADGLARESAERAGCQCKPRTWARLYSRAATGAVGRVAFQALLAHDVLSRVDRIGHKQRQEPSLSFRAVCGTAVKPCPDTNRCRKSRDESRFLVPRPVCPIFTRSRATFRGLRFRQPQCEHAKARV